MRSSWAAAVLVCACACAASVGASVRDAADLQWWVVGSPTKVFREDVCPRSPIREVRLDAARNEWEAAQVALRVRRPVDLTAAHVSALTSTDGAVLPSRSVHLLRVAYVPVPKHKKDFPDPLPPLRLPLAIAPERTQPIWLAVHVPAETQPGRYAGQLRLEFRAHAGIEVPIEVRVRRFEVPVRPSMRTAFGISDNWVAEQHRVPLESARHAVLHAAYYEFLMSHRISPYNIPVDLTSPAARRYLDDPRLTAFVIPYTDDEKVLRATVGALQPRDWLSMGYFYVVDEPITRDQYARLREVCERIHRIDPTLKVVAPYYRNPDFDSAKTVYDLLPGTINIWCPNSMFFRPEQLAARQALGEEVWWYVCCGPGWPYANFFVDMPATAHRILMWQQKKYNVEGLLYWSTTWWNPASTRDPWEDMATVKDINPALYGDGSLVYPGAKVGVDGPVSSLRLEVIRDGLEDYEYLTMYERRYGADRTQALIARLVKSMTEFSTDPIALAAVRTTIADALDRP